MADQGPRVTSRHPSDRVIKIVNPVLKAILRSPAHRALSKHLMILTVTGRKTGRTYDVVVARQDVDGGVVVLGGAPWGRNLRGGAPVRMLVGGRQRAGFAELGENPRHVAETFHEVMVRQGGVKAARMLGLAVQGSQTPSVEEIMPAVTDRNVVRIRYTDA